LVRDLSRGPEILLAEGFVTDQVMETTVTCQHSSFREHMVEYHEWLLKAKEIFNNNFMRNSKRRRADLKFVIMAFTMIASQLESGLRAQPEDLVALVKHLESLKPCHDEEVLEVYVEIFELLCEGYCFGRKFFATTTGRMVLGPAPMLAGDLVVILRGGRFPFLLRKTHEEHRIVGTAYVHRITDGEAVREWQARGDPEMPFHIH
jgi:hypothetical protein